MWPQIIKYVIKNKKKTAEDNKKNDNAREVQKPNKEKEMIIFFEVHWKAAGMLNSPWGQLFKVRRSLLEPNTQREWVLKEKKKRQPWMKF